jgi:uncharacterized protein YjbI with pentapeptide repeats
MIAPRCQLCSLTVLQLKGQCEVVDPLYARGSHIPSDLVGWWHSGCLATHEAGRVWFEARLKTFRTIRGYVLVAELDGWTVLQSPRSNERIALGHGGQKYDLHNTELATSIAVDGGRLIPVQVREFNLHLDATPANAALIAAIQLSLDSVGSHPLADIVSRLGISDRLLHPQAIADGAFRRERRLRPHWSRCAVAARIDHGLFVPSMLAHYAGSANLAYTGIRRPMPSIDENLLRAAHNHRAASLDTSGLRPRLVRGIEEGWFDRAELRELAWSLRDRRNHAVDDLAFEPRGEVVDVIAEGVTIAVDIGELAACVKDLAREPEGEPGASMTAAELRSRLESHDAWVASLGRAGAQARLSHADLRRVDKAGLLLPDVVLHHAVLTSDKLAATDLHSATLFGASLNGADLSASTLDEADADGADFRGAEMLATKLVRASLVGASFERADMSAAVLDHADLLDARLDGANLRSTSLRGTIFERTSLVGADLRGAKELASAHVRSIIVGTGPGDYLVGDAARAWMDAAIREQRRAPQPGTRRVSVVELRSFDGVREKVDARFVLTADGTVVTVAPSEHHRRIADRDVERGLPGPNDTYVTRDAGLAFLQLLAPTFRGSRHYATTVFEMDEDEALTIAPPA